MKNEILVIDDNPDIRFLICNILKEKDYLVRSAANFNQAEIEIDKKLPDLAIIDKRRPRANEAEVMNLIGDVEGRTAILVDDMVDTAGTLTKAADLMKKRGAISVRAICTHALLSGDAYQKIEGSQLEELIVTDSIPAKVRHPKVKVLSCAPLFAEVMKNVHHNQSISSKFIM